MTQPIISLLCNFLTTLGNYSLEIATLILAGATFLLWRATSLLKKTSDSQLTATLTGRFQDEWHSRQTRLMRNCLKEKEFIRVFNNAISIAYGKTIDFENNFEDLLNSPPPPISDRLEKFKQYLDDAIYYDRATGLPLFTAYEALDHILITWDRLAAVRKDPQAIMIIKQYKPPIRDLSDILQALIAVRITLTEDNKKKNYKKDYTLLLHNLDLHNEALFEVCKNGLKVRQELTDEEIRKEKKLYKDNK